MYHGSYCVIENDLAKQAPEANALAAKPLQPEIEYGAKQHGRNAEPEQDEQPAGGREPGFAEPMAANRRGR